MKYYLIYSTISQKNSLNKSVLTYFIFNILLFVIYSIYVTSKSKQWENFIFAFFILSKRLYTYDVYLSFAIRSALFHILDAINYFDATPILCVRRSVFRLSQPSI